MSTASTKSRARKRARAAGENAPRGDAGRAPAADAPPSPHTSALTELSPRAWLIACLLVFVVAAALRLYGLELRPMHHDEGVNGHFLLRLMRGGGYAYDPANYHGPTLYYFTLPVALAFDRLGALGTWAVRLVPAVFGLLTIWLVLALRRYVGAVGALSAAALLAVSPGMVFFSRYFIHEMMFVCFTLGIVVAALRFFDTPRREAKAGAPLDLLIIAAANLLVISSLVATYWPKALLPALVLMLLGLCGLVWSLWRYDGPRAIYLLLGALSLGLLFATKETAFISVGVLLIATAMARVYVSYARPASAATDDVKNRKKQRGGGGKGARTDEPRVSSLVGRAGGWQRVAVLSLAGLGVFLFVNVLFYSSFFTNAKGVKDAFEAYAIWKKTGTSEFHKKPLFTYFNWLRLTEAPLLLVGAAGAVLSALRPRARFPLFAALWAFGTLAAYSLINYKTPWLQISAVAPLAVAAGYAVEVLYRRDTRRGARPLLAGLALACALGVCLYQTIQLNYFHYADEREPYIYVYAHTKADFLNLIDQLDRVASAKPDKYSASVYVAAPEYWPLPWYVRDYKRIGYSGQVAATADDIVIGSDKQLAQLEATLGGRYARVGGYYELRPGVVLVLFARRELVRP